jgi:hypothetical protein
VGIQEVRWDQWEIIFSLGKRNENHQLGTRLSVQHRTVMSLEFVRDRMSYIVLRGHRCNVIVLNVHASSEKSDDSKTVFEELQQVFAHAMQMCSNF